MPTTEEERAARFNRAAAEYAQAQQDGDHRSAADIAQAERVNQHIDNADDGAAQHNRTSGGRDLLGGGAAPGPAPAGEVTGIRSAIAQLDAIAAAHSAHAGDEGFIGSLARMEVGADDQQRARAAQEQSRNAAEMWAEAAASVRRNNMPVAEAYSQSPGAGNKQAQLNE